MRVVLHFAKGFQTGPVQELVEVPEVGLSLVYVSVWSLLSASTRSVSRNLERVSYLVVVWEFFPGALTVVARRQRRLAKSHQLAKDDYDLLSIMTHTEEGDGPFGEIQAHMRGMRKFESILYL